MQPLAAVGSLFLTLVLVVARPRVGRFGRLNPVGGALPGVVLMFAAGVLKVHDLRRGLELLWRPFVTLASIMVMTAMAHRLGIFDRLTRSIEIRTRRPVPVAFTTVYVIGAATAALFNNDAAILLLTPIVVPVIRRLYPQRGGYLVVPFSFAIFMSAGIAPLCTSNPMNLVVADHAGLGFNAYALRMLPVAVVGSIATYAMMRVAFRQKLEDVVPATGREAGSLPDMGGSSTAALLVILAMFASYPILSYFDGPVWIAALAGAALTCVLALREDSITLRNVADGVAWDILVFLYFIFVTALGLENIGVTELMAQAYRSAGSGPADGIGRIGAFSALGSAVLNNHPMAALNALAIASLPGDNRWRTLAALVGGDLGPRLLPIGSLAGLLWLEMLRRLNVEVRATDFVRIGFVVTIPALLASFATLWIEARLFPP